MINRGLRKQVYHVRVAFQCKYGSSYEGDKNGDREDGSDISGGGERVEISWSLVCKDLVLCGKLEEDLRAMLGGFAEGCKKRCLIVKADRDKIMVLSGEERLEFEVM